LGALNATQASALALLEGEIEREAHARVGALEAMAARVEGVAAVGASLNASRVADRAEFMERVAEVVSALEEEASVRAWDVVSLNATVSRLEARVNASMWAAALSGTT
jgi:hypothetical protein